ncbi:MAG: phosphosulfolactate synthase, partial [Bacteroidota bacterium]
MNADLPHIPKREPKKRNKGITMVMDKGLSINELIDFIQVSGEYVDYVKLGFGTGMVTPNLEEKIRLYKEAAIEPYFGGTLYEVFKIRGLFDQFIEFIDKYQVDVVEVSDGAINMSHDKKLKDISRLSKGHTVLSEVGSKKADEIISPDAWKSQIKSELDAGSHKVIT